MVQSYVVVKKGINHHYPIVLYMIVVYLLCHVQLYPQCSQQGSSVHGISQARILEWLPFPFPGDLPNPGIKLTSPAWQADSFPLSHLGSPLYVIEMCKSTLSSTVATGHTWPLNT